MIATRTNNRGFTLLEVLIALAVVAIALVAFVSAGAQNADYANYIHNRTIAQWVARNQLVVFQLAPTWPAVGTQSNDVQMADATWHWTATITSSPDPDVRRVDMRVYTVDPTTGKPATDPVLLLSGFLTQHPKAVNNPPAGATGASNTATSTNSDQGAGNDDDTAGANGG